MPSPIAHVAMGYAVARLAERWMPEQLRPATVPVIRLFAATAVLSMLPDADIIPGILLNDFGHFHNNFSHSLGFALMVALFFACSVWLIRRSGFWFWWGVTFAAYTLHVVMDLFTRGRGVLLLWPLAPERVPPPVEFFYGVRWSHGLVSTSHLWTIATELTFAAAVIVVVEVIVYKLKRLQRPRQTASQYKRSARVSRARLAARPPEFDTEH